MVTSAFLAAICVVLIAIVLLTVLLGVGRPTRAQLNPEGFQEQEIVVKGRYLPEVVAVRRGIPVQLHFRRDEEIPCSERVIFSDFHVGSRLPAHQVTTVSFIPTRCGEFLFTCAFGMYQGRLVVVEPSDRDLAKIQPRQTESTDTDRQLPGLAARSATALGSAAGGSTGVKKEQSDA